MQPEEIEEMLYHRAMRTKIRPAFAERLTNLAYNRVIATGAMAAAALTCTLAMGTKSTQPAGLSSQPMHPQMTDTKPGNPLYQSPDRIDNTDPITASLAMSRIGN